MEIFRADLHVHTVLSPCAEIEMIPPLIVQEALERQIDLIAITDHNASANVAAVQRAAQGSGLAVLPGMEVQSREEVHILCLFETPEQLAEWQTQVDAALPDLPNRPDFFGEQLVVDHEGEFIRTEARLLLTSTRFSIDDIYERVNQIGGLVIPAHVERTSNGLFPTLGLVSASWPVEAFEISRHTTPEKVRVKFPAIDHYPLIQSGDVHMLDSFLGTTFFTLKSRTLAEIRLALRSQDGRTVTIKDSQ
ncbi:MAG: PHP domain-containing protein [Anaerolineales bacterium]|jgi:PHP family Zn ribbon phosphoesterase|nr:PHP domain-containing protein [Anaerolineales bacterium]